MNYFLWKGSSSSELKRFGESISWEIGKRVLGFPKFGCYSTSDLYMRFPAAGLDYYARAHTGRSYIRRKITSATGSHWIIEFNGTMVEGHDIEMILYHELAHFICRSINRSAPSHGLLWAACYDALHIIMEMDEFSSNEGTVWLFETNSFKIESTFASDMISSRDEWFEIRERTRDVICKRIKSSTLPISYIDLINVIKVSVRKGHSDI